MTFRPIRRKHDCIDKLFFFIHKRISYFYYEFSINSAEINHRKRFECTETLFFVSLQLNWLIFIVDIIFLWLWSEMQKKIVDWIWISLFETIYRIEQPFRNHRIKWMRIFSTENWFQRCFFFISIKTSA